MARRLDPAIRIASKQSSGLMGLYGAIIGEQFMIETATTIGPLHWYPENWPDIEKPLYHEARHNQQMRWFGLGSIWLGFVMFSLVNLIIRIPGFWSLTFELELDAEAFALAHKYRTGSSPAYIKAELEEFAKRLAGAGYMWCVGREIAAKRARRRAMRIISKGK